MKFYRAHKQEVKAKWKQLDLWLGNKWRKRTQTYISRVHIFWGAENKGSLCEQHYFITHHVGIIITSKTENDRAF